MEELGSLIGLITVKDVLKFIAVERDISSPSWNGLRGVDVLFQEAWMWILQLLQGGMNWCHVAL